MRKNDVDGTVEVTVLDTEAAVGAIRDYAGSSFQARLIIADALHSGSVDAYAERVLLVDNFDPTADWSEIVDQGREPVENTFVDHDIWRSSINWPAETRFWDWKAGNFLIVTVGNDHDYFSGWILEGVSVDAGQLMDLMGRTDRTGVGGKPMDRERWAKFWLLIMREASDYFDWTQFTTRNQLKSFFLGCTDDTDGEFKSSSNIDFAVELAWEYLVQHQAAQNRQSLADRISGE